MAAVDLDGLDETDMVQVRQHATFVATGVLSIHVYRVA